MSLLARWDPWGELQSLRQRMNQLFEETARRAEEGETVPVVAWVPTVDVKETEGEFILHVEVPGVKPEDVSVSLQEGTLVIEGERKFEDEQHRENYIRIERTYGRFRRAFALRTPVDIEKVNATYHEGVLKVVLPKAEAAKPRKIEVRTN